MMILGGSLTVSDGFVMPLGYDLISTSYSDIISNLNYDFLLLIITKFVH